jgi:hypothetical protein
VVRNRYAVGMTRYDRPGVTRYDHPATAAILRQAVVCAV